MGKAAQSPEPQVRLSTAAVWGTTVLAARALQGGESLQLGAGPDALVAQPESAQVVPSPIVAISGGWQLDARGATGGSVSLRGRSEDPRDLGIAGTPVAILPGDHGLIQYGSFSIFFQFTDPPPPLERRYRIDWMLFFSVLFALFTIGGGMLILYLQFGQPALEKPVALTSQEELKLKFQIEEEPPPPAPGEDAAGKGIKDPGAKDKKDMGGGKKAKGTEGQTGKKGEAEQTKAPGEVQQGLGAMSEVLSSEVGAEIHETLGAISSVAEALGGLGSDSLVLGKGGGLGFRGSGSGGGGDSDGVPFGAGTLDTGMGPGKGGGLGRGAGGPGGKGRGGFGKGGSGDGDGAGDGEKKVVGGDKAARGQGLSPSQIQRVVSSRYGAFRACYESAQARNPTLKGGVTVAWTITPGGSVTGARISGSSLGNARVEGCILRQFRRLRFPTADKASGASYPFVFRPSK